MDWGPPIDSGGQEISEYEIFMDIFNGEMQSQSGGYRLVGSINIPDGSSDAPTLRTIRLDSLSRGLTHRLKYEHETRLQRLWEKRRGARLEFN